MHQEEYDNNKEGLIQLEKKHFLVPETVSSTKSSLTGFTLIEVLVSVAVLMIAMTPLFMQVQASFRLSRTINENLTATMLAQEGVELIRGVRDDNWFNNQPYDKMLLIPPACQTECHIQYDDTKPRPRAGPTPPLRLDTQGRYQYDEGADTIFTRGITITEENDGPTNFLRIKSEVTWEVNDEERSVIVEEFLFDWLNQ